MRRPVAILPYLVRHRDDGTQFIPALLIGVDLAPQEIALVVVDAIGIAMPHVEHSVRQSLALRIEHTPGYGQRRALHTGLDQGRTLGRPGLVERSLDIVFGFVLAFGVQRAAPDQSSRTERAYAEDFSAKDWLFHTPEGI